MPAGGSIRLHAEGTTIEGAEVSKTVILPLGAAGTGEERLMSAGLALREEDGRMLIDLIQFGSVAERAGLDFDFEITRRAPGQRPPAPGADLAPGAARCSAASCGCSAGAPPPRPRRPRPHAPAGED